MVATFLNFFLDYFWRDVYNLYMMEYEITIIRDDEAAVWVAENNDIPVALESDSLDLLIERVRNAVPELLELNGKLSKNITLCFTMNCQQMAA